LESFLGREATFDIPATTTAAVIQGIATVCQQLQAAAGAARGAAGRIAAPSSGNRPTSDQQWAAAASVYVSSCSLLVAITRHRPQQLSRLMHLMIGAARQLLLLLLSWDHIVCRCCESPGRRVRDRYDGSVEGSSSSSSAAMPEQQGVAAMVVKCAAQLGRLYESLSQQQQWVGRHCHHVISDYLMCMTAAAAAAAAPALAAHPVQTPLGGVSEPPSVLWTQLLPQKEAQAASSVGLELYRAGGGSSSCTGEVAAAVRHGACALFGVLCPGQVQAVHRVVSQGQLSSAGRSALTDLKQEFETRLKHHGKV
jgi:hypothetical protein